MVSTAKTSFPASENTSSKGVKNNLPTPTPILPFGIDQYLLPSETPFRKEFRGLLRNRSTPAFVDANSMTNDMPLQSEPVPGNDHVALKPSLRHGGSLMAVPSDSTHVIGLQSTAKYLIMEDPVASSVISDFARKMRRTLGIAYSYTSSKTPALTSEKHKDVIDSRTTRSVSKRHDFEINPILTLLTDAAARILTRMGSKDFLDTISSMKMGPGARDTPIVGRSTQEGGMCDSDTVLNEKFMKMRDEYWKEIVCLRNRCRALDVPVDTMSTIECVIDELNQEARVNMSRSGEGSPKRIDMESSMKEENTNIIEEETSVRNVHEGCEHSSEQKTLKRGEPKYSFQPSKYISPENEKYVQDVVQEQLRLGLIKLQRQVTSAKTHHSRKEPDQNEVERLRSSLKTAEERGRKLELLKNSMENRLTQLVNQLRDIERTIDSKTHDLEHRLHVSDEQKEDLTKTVESLKEQREDLRTQLGGMGSELESLTAECQSLRTFKENASSITEQKKFLEKRVHEMEEISKTKMMNYEAIIMDLEENMQINERLRLRISMDYEDTIHQKEDQLNDSINASSIRSNDVIQILTEEKNQLYEEYKTIISRTRMLVEDIQTGMERLDLNSNIGEQEDIDILDEARSKTSQIFRENIFFSEVIDHMKMREEDLIYQKMRLSQENEFLEKSAKSKEFNEGEALDSKIDGLKSENIQLRDKVRDLTEKLRKVAETTANGNYGDLDALLNSLNSKESSDNSVFERLYNDAVRRMNRITLRKHQERLLRLEEAKIHRNRENFFASVAMSKTWGSDHQSMGSIGSYWRPIGESGETNVGCTHNPRRSLGSKNTNDRFMSITGSRTFSQSRPASGATTNTRIMRPRIDFANTSPLFNTMTSGSSANVTMTKNPMSMSLPQFHQTRNGGSSPIFKCGCSNNSFSEGKCGHSPCRCQELTNMCPAVIGLTRKLQMERDNGCSRSLSDLTKYSSNGIPVQIEKLKNGVGNNMEDGLDIESQSKLKEHGSLNLECVSTYGSTGGIDRMIRAPSEASINSNL